MSKRDILNLIKKDKWMMDVLRAAESLHLSDWWIGAGFVRSKVWDHLHGFKERTPLPDIDLIYFEKKPISEIRKDEKKFEKILNRRKELCVKWQVKNQARMHVYHHRKPYKNSEEALSDWTETATCIGVKLENGKLKLVAPWGVDDLIKGIVRPTFKTDSGIRKFKKRLEEKNWLEKWPRLRIIS